MYTVLWLYTFKPSFIFLQQLDPTIQGSDAANECGLEQTLFDRLIKMVWLSNYGLFEMKIKIHINLFIILFIITKFWIKHSLKLDMGVVENTG